MAYWDDDDASYDDCCNVQLTASIYPSQPLLAMLYRTTQRCCCQPGSWAARLLPFSAYGKATSSAAVAVEAQVEATGRQYLPFITDLASTHTMHRILDVQNICALVDVLSTTQIEMLQQAVEGCCVRFEVHSAPCNPQSNCSNCSLLQLLQ